jgi:hypothetical protein
MKAKHIFIATLVAMFSLTAVAQHQHHMMQKEDKEKDGMSKMMGKPVFEQSVQGVKVQAWLITQEEHKKMMSGQMHGSGEAMEKMSEKKASKESNMEEMHNMMHGAKDTSMHAMHSKMDHSTMMEAMMSGTHHVMVTITDEKKGDPVDEKEITIQLTAPSTKYSTVKLVSMMNHFGAGLAFDEKGIYKVDLVLGNGKETKNITFSYEVK